MNRTKKWMIAAFALMGAGVLICVISFILLGRNFSKLSTVGYVTRTHEPEGSFENISIDADTEKIKLVPSDNEGCRVVCYEEEKNPFDVRVDGDTLRIDRKNEKPQLHFGIVLDSPSITVYLPKEKYGELDVDADTGSVSVPGDFSFDSIDIELDTGDVQLRAGATGDIQVRTDTGDIDIEDITAATLSVGTGTGRARLKAVRCGKLISKGDTGDLTLEDVLADELFDLQRDTGDIKLTECDAGDIYIRTDTGSVTGTILTEKVFWTQTDTGRVNVPESGTGGKCEITTDTGSIRIEMAR